MRLRDVQPDDVEAYVRMRCDPVMMAELGGPLRREGIEEKVRNDVKAARSGAAWLKMILAGDGDPQTDLPEPRRGDSGRTERA